MPDDQGTAAATVAPPTPEDTALPPPQMRERKTDLRVKEGNELRGVAAVKAAADGEKLLPDEQRDALDWFLSEEPEDHAASDDTIEVNVGSRHAPTWIEWKIKAVDDDVLRKIEKLSKKAKRRPGEEDLRDDIVQNSRVIAEGTIYPDLTVAAQRLGVADPAFAVRARFEKKPGLIAQIAGHIMAVSGFDSDDVREGQAAGN